MNITEVIKNKRLVMDGAMGTYFSEKFPAYPHSCEYANIDRPEYILEIHREYLEAGADALKTNTFSANPLNSEFSGDKFEEVIRAGCRIAKQAVEESGRDAVIFGDLGPLPGADAAVADQIYRQLVDMFVGEGICNFMFETNSNTLGLHAALAHIREVCPDAYVIASFAVQSDGYTREGLHYADLFREMAGANVNAVGMNCIISAPHMFELVQKLELEGPALCMMPNGGYPHVFGRRVVYDGDPAFFCDEMMKIAAAGVGILGGCCGTKPEFIRMLADAVAGREIGPVPAKIRPRSVRRAQTDTNRFWNKMESGKKVIAVEFDTPRNDVGETFMAGAWQLKSAGVDAITLADCPTAQARMDSSIMACKLRRELDIDVIPHMTCRDRNINATKALLLGLSMEGVRNVLLITGDPIPSAERDEVKTVYQFNSRMLARFVKSLNENELKNPFQICGALNINARNFRSQINMAKMKIENGVTCLLTQPVLTEQALENLKLAKAELNCRILGGIIPVVSARNARFMNSEINGINVDEAIIERYEGKSRDECTQLAIEISSDIARRIAPYVDGYYLMTPFSRVDIITEVVKNIRAME